MRTARTPAMRGAAAVAVALLAAGCGASSQATGAKRSSASPPAGAKPVAMSGIAEAIGCKPDVQTAASDIEQAECRTKKGHYVMVTFTSQKGQNAWLSMSKDYGGTYLVGSRWVVTSKPTALLPLQEKLGGSFEEGTNHSAHSG